MLKINFLLNLPVCSISTSLTSIQLQRHVVLSMVFSYLFSKSYLAQKLFVDLINIRVVPCISLDLTARYNICDEGLNPGLFGGTLAPERADTPLHSMPVDMAVTSTLLTPCRNFKF